MTGALPGLAFGVLLCLAGCSTESGLRPLMPAAAPLPAQPTWSVRVAGCVRAQDCTTLRAIVVETLMQAKLLQRAVPPDQAAPLALDVAVVRFHAVSDSLRNQRGLLAGRNEIGAVVTLKDAKGAALRAFRVDVEGGSSLYGDGNSQQDAYRGFERELVAGLKGS